MKKIECRMAEEFVCGQKQRIPLPLKSPICYFSLLENGLLAIPPKFKFPPDSESLTD